MRTKHVLGALVLVALLAAAGSASAQTLSAAQTSTALSLTAADYPLTITHTYQRGSVTRTYQANGTYTESTANGLGDLVSITVFGATTRYGVIDNETTPGTGRKALVSFTSREAAEGTTGIIVVDVIVF